MIRCKTALLLTLALSAGAWYDCRSQYFFESLATLGSYSDPECGCNVTLHEVLCHVDTPTRPLRIDIECASYNSNYTAIRVEEFSRASNFTLIALRMTNCKIPSTFVSLLANFGHADAELLEIALEKVMGELQGAHVRGLRKVRKIGITSYPALAAQKYRVFHDLIDDIPDLEEFIVTLTKLRLEGREGDDSIEGNSRSALRILILTDCRINDVPPGAFARLGNITQLDLSRNLIKNFTMNAFRGLTNLESLILSHNPITSLPPRAFAFTPRLRHLNLDETRLRTVPSEAFQGLQHLEIITYDWGNDTITFGARALALSSLEMLTIHSALQSPLPKDLIEGSVNLQMLIISYAGLKIIPKGFFASQQRLNWLDLSYNELTTLNADVFQSLNELGNLNLTGNRIKEFPAYVSA